MSDGHFRSLQPRIGRSLYEKSASKKSPHFEKKLSKNPPSYRWSPSRLLEELVIPFMKSGWFLTTLSFLEVSLVVTSRFDQKAEFKTNNFKVS